jgi:mono/diheme cytochrome c family protein
LSEIREELTVSGINNRKTFASLIVAVTAGLAVAAIGQEAEPLGGAQLFIDTCGGCHGDGGEGGYGPPITSNNFVDDATKLVLRIINGGEVMPTFRHLPDEEIAVIANFVRTQLNENEDLIDAALVAAQRD